MARLFIQYLAIKEKENLPNSIKIFYQTHKTSKIWQSCELVKPDLVRPNLI